MNKNRLHPLLTISLSLISTTLLLSGCGDKTGAGGPQMPPTQVEVLAAIPQAVDILRTLPARTSAYMIAEIRPQVSGIILKREFSEGGQVEEGQSLYQIDPATYQAQVSSAKANLASARASSEVSRLTLERYKSLLRTKATSQQEYDKAAADNAQTNAAVMIAKAALENAEINLSYTKVNSPIRGRIGKSVVTEGALVTASQITPLTTVQQLDPIYVDMTQSSTEYLRLKRELAEQTIKQKDGKALIKLTLEDGSVYNHQGTLEFSDVTVNETTGSISLRAIFPNPDLTLLPGMFVRASMYQGTRNNVFLIPQKAVMRDARGNNTVNIVTADNTVESRNVEIQDTYENSWIVTSGLKTNDKIIITGLQKVAEGATVIIRPTPQALGSTEQPPQSQK